MNRMGKAVPEAKPTALPTKSFSGASSVSTAAMKKVYCTPKITFVGELISCTFTYMWGGLVV